MNKLKNNIDKLDDSDNESKISLDKLKIQYYIISKMKYNRENKDIKKKNLLDKKLKLKKFINSMKIINNNLFIQSKI